jgi:hypothetical protein
MPSIKVLGGTGGKARSAVHRRAYLVRRVRRTHGGTHRPQRHRGPGGRREPDRMPGGGFKPVPRHGLECALDPRGLRKRRRRNFRRGSGLQSPPEKRKNLAADPVRCFCRRWRHLRHRPSSAFRSSRTRPRFPLRLPQQRGLHEHRGSALERNPKIRLGDHCALWRGDPWKAPEAERISPKSSSPTAFPMWPRLRYPTSSILPTKSSGP